VTNCIHPTWIKTWMYITKFHGWHNWIHIINHRSLITVVGKTTVCERLLYTEYKNSKLPLKYLHFHKCNNRSELGQRYVPKSKPA
jgi:hypothetical protein